MNVFLCRCYLTEEQKYNRAANLSAVVDQNELIHGRIIWRLCKYHNI